MLSSVWPSCWLLWLFPVFSRLCILTTPSLFRALLIVAWVTLMSKASARNQQTCSWYTLGCLARKRSIACSYFTQPNPECTSPLSMFALYRPLTCSCSGFSLLGLPLCSGGGLTTLPQVLRFFRIFRNWSRVMWVRSSIIWLVSPFWMHSVTVRLTSSLRSFNNCSEGMANVGCCENSMMVV